MTPTGLTKNAGWQIGVRKTLPVALEDAWNLLVSEEGLSVWLGGLSGFEPSEGAEYVLSDGTRGKITVFKQISHLRLTWHPPGWQRPSIIQVRVIPSGKKKTVFAFHQEHLPDQEEREERRAFFKNAVARLAEKLD